MQFRLLSYQVCFGATGFLLGKRRESPECVGSSFRFCVGWVLQGRKTCGLRGLSMSTSHSSPVYSFWLG